MLFSGFSALLMSQITRSDYIQRKFSYIYIHIIMSSWPVFLVSLQGTCHIFTGRRYRSVVLLRIRAAALMCAILFASVMTVYSAQCDLM